MVELRTALMMTVDECDVVAVELQDALEVTGLIIVVEELRCTVELMTGLTITVAE